MKKKVLIVDNNETDLIELKKLLKGFNISITKALSGDKALKKLIKNDFALIIIKVQMPDIDGLDTIKKLRQQNNNKFLPVIFISNTPLKDKYLIKKEFNGAVDLLIKPLIPQLLKIRVKNFLDYYQQKSNQQELQHQLLADHITQKKYEETLANLQNELETSTQKINKYLLMTESLKMEVEKSKNETNALNMELEGSLERANHMTKEAEIANITKSQFLANISHEIRTPMNAIIGFAEILLEDKLSEEHAHSVNMILESGNTLLSLINGILDLSKIEADKLSIEDINFDLEKVLIYSSEVARSKIKNQNIEIICDYRNVPLNLVGDPLRLQQILINLLGNAVKFTKQGTISITVSYLQEKNDRINIEFAVQDSGIGIAKEKFDHIFQVFNQENGSTSRKYGGTGLGLTISKKLIELMDGNIYLSSEENKGTTFTFNVWLKQQASLEQPVILQCLINTKILIIDSIPQVREIIAALLNNQTMTVVNASSINEALEVLEEQSFDIILVNIHSQQFNQDIDKKLIALTKVSKVITMTSHNINNIHKHLKMLGMPINLIKPFSKESLINSLEKVICKTKPATLLTKPSMPTNNVDFSHLKVLLAEDNETNQEVTKKMFQKLGINIVIASTGKKAIEIITTQKPDIIFMDIQMPEMDGYKATKLLRKSGIITPIIAITAHMMIGDKEKCLDAGMNDYISKPVRKHNLLDALNHFSQGDYDINKDALKILIAEDDDDLLSALSEIIKTAFPDAVTQGVYDGKDVLHLLESFIPDIVIIDLLMSNINGLDVIKHLQNHTAFNHTKTIAITGLHATDELVKGAQARNIDIIFKPFKFSHIIDLIKKNSTNKLDTTPANIDQNSEIDFLISLANKLELNLDDYIMILKTFIKNSNERIKQLDRELQNKNYDQAKKIVHSIKGSSANLALDKISEIASTLEDALNNNEEERISTLHALLNSTYQSTLNITLKAFEKNSAKDWN